MGTNYSQTIHSNYYILEMNNGIKSIKIINELFKVNDVMNELKLITNKAQACDRGYKLKVSASVNLLLSKLDFLRFVFQFVQRLEMSVKP